MVRINKYLAKCNLGSRRKVEKFITDGHISVNGKKMTNLAKQIDEKSDIVKFKGKTIKPIEEKVYIILNKPPKYIVSTKDEFGRKTIYDLLPKFKIKLFYVGRLDYMSEGLVLLTNDGSVANKIIHPRNKIPKTYKIKIKGHLDNNQIKQLRDGIVINNKKTLPAKVFVNKTDNNYSSLKIIIKEGRKRQIRRMIKAVGSEVLRLKRLQIGNVKLKKMPPGTWRYLKINEVKKLKQLIKESKDENRNNRQKKGR